MNKSIFISTMLASSLLLAACQEEATEAEPVNKAEVNVESETEQQSDTQQTEADTNEEQEEETNINVAPKMEDDAQVNRDESAESDTEVAEPVQQTTSLFTQYEEKMASVSAQAERVYDNAVTTVELEEAAQKAFSLWDSLLNEMYGVLKEELPPAEFEELRADQREWITERDDFATYQATEQANGGSAYTMLYIDAQAQYTAQRCSDFLYEIMIDL